MNHGGGEMRCEGGPWDGRIVFVPPYQQHIRVPVVDAESNGPLSDASRHPRDGDFEVFTYKVCRRAFVEHDVLHKQWVLIPA